MHMYVFIYVTVCVCVYLYVSVYVYACVRTYVPMYICDVHVYMRMQPHHMYVCVCV